MKFRTMIFSFIALALVSGGSAVYIQQRMNNAKPATEVPVQKTEPAQEHVPPKLPRAPAVRYSDQLVRTQDI